MAEDYSGQALLTFLDYERDKGLVKEATIASRKASVNAVFGILSPEELSDVRELDLEKVMSRFANKRGTDFTPDSLKVYKSRVSSAIRDLIEYRRDPATFKTSTSPRPSRAPKNEKQSSDGQTSKNDQPDKKYAVWDNEIAFPIPIRADAIVKLIGVPSDLTKREATKIANIVMALAQTDEDI